MKKLEKSKRRAFSEKRRTFFYFLAFLSLENMFNLFIFEPEQVYLLDTKFIIAYNCCSLNCDLHFRFTSGNIFLDTQIHDCLT